MKSLDDELSSLELRCSRDLFLALVALDLFFLFFLRFLDLSLSNELDKISACRSKLLFTGVSW